MCAGYQTGTYSITMYGNNGAVVDHFGPIKYTQENNSEQMLIVKGLRPDLILGSQYEVEVTVESLGIFRSRRKNFSKMESICVKLQIIYLLHLASPHPPTNTHALDPHPMTSIKLTTIQVQEGNMLPCMYCDL